MAVRMAATAVAKPAFCPFGQVICLVHQHIVRFAPTVPSPMLGRKVQKCGHTENQNQATFYPFVPREISVLTKLALGHLRYRLTDVPPQPNSPHDTVFDSDGPPERTLKPEGKP